MQRLRGERRTLLTAYIELSTAMTEKYLDRISIHIDGEAACHSILVRG